MKLKLGLALVTLLGAATVSGAASAADCAGTAECLQGCEQGDETCTAACVAAAESTEAADAAQAYLTCKNSATETCATEVDPAACVAAACITEWEACSEPGEEEGGEEEGGEEEGGEEEGGEEEGGGDPLPIPGEPCPVGLTFEGFCSEAGGVYWCENEIVNFIDCAANGLGCGFSEQGGFYDCQQAGGGGDGSCEGVCGGQSPDGTCWCDNQCAQFGDCCADYQQFCGGGGGAENSCEGACGGPAPGNQCYCDADCTQFNDCCTDYQQFCGDPGGELGEPLEPGTPCPEGLDYAGYCGTDGAVYWCENEQVNRINCPDGGATCGWNSGGQYYDCIGGGGGDGGSCVGNCGGEAPSGCFCDDECEGFGDCCPDYQQACGGGEGGGEGGGGDQTCPAGLGPEGTCDGNLLKWCADSKLNTQDCAASGLVCGVSDLTGEYDCLATSGGEEGGVGEEGGSEEGGGEEGGGEEGGRGEGGGGDTSGGEGGGGDTSGGEGGGGGGDTSGGDDTGNEPGEGSSDEGGSSGGGGSGCSSTGQSAGSFAWALLAVCGVAVLRRRRL